MLVYFRADNAYLSDISRRANSYVGFARNVIEVYPFAAFTLNYTLCAKYKSILSLILKSLKDSRNRLFIVFLYRFSAKACEHLVCVVMMVMSVLVIVVMMIVVVTSAITMLVMLVVLVMMVMLVLIVIVVVMIVVVASAITMLVMLVMMVMLVLIVVVVMMIVVVMIVVVASAITMLVVLVMLVMMVMMLVLHKALKLLLDRRTSFHSGKQLLPVKSSNRSGYHNRATVMLLNQSKCLGKLLFGGLIGVAENNTSRVFYLIVEELTEILHIHFALINVNNNGKAVELNILCARGSNRTDNVAELSYARRLDKHSVGSILRNHLFKRFAEISNERATDTTGIHFGYIDSRILQESAIYAYLAEFVLNENYLLTRIRFVDKLVYKSRLSRSEKARYYIDFCHIYTSYLLLADEISIVGKRMYTERAKRD